MSTAALVAACTVVVVLLVLIGYTAIRLTGACDAFRKDLRDNRRPR